MFILSLVSAFAVLLYGSGGPSLPFNPAIPVYTNQFSQKTITLYPNIDGSQAPVNIRGTNPHPINCIYGEPIINTSDKSTGTWSGCLDQRDGAKSYATIGFSAGGNDWYTMSSVLDSVPNDGRSYLVTNISIDYQCHGNGDYPIFAFMRPKYPNNVPTGQSFITRLATMFGVNKTLISPLYSKLNESLSLSLPVLLSSYHLLPLLNNQPFGGETGGIVNSTTNYIYMTISNPYKICERSGASNLGPYSNFTAYGYSQNMAGNDSLDLSFAGIRLNDFFGGSGANLLVYPGLGPGASSDLLQISYIAVRITYRYDMGCSYIPTSNIFTSVPNALGFVGCVIQGLGYLAIDFSLSAAGFFIYLGAWLLYIVQVLGNFVSILIWMYNIPGLPGPIQAFVSVVVTVWIGIIGIETYKAIDPFGD